MKRTAALFLLLPLLLGGCAQTTGSAGAAPAAASTPSASVTPTPSAPAPTAAGAKAALDAFFAQVKVDSVPYMAKSEAVGGVKADNDTKKALFRDVFQKSLTFMDPSMHGQSAQDFVVAYATWFIMDPKATIATDETAFTLSGDTASVQGTSFKWNAMGMSLPKATDDANTHTVTLTATNGKWLISGYALTH